MLLNIQCMHSFTMRLSMCPYTELTVHGRSRRLSGQVPFKHKKQSSNPRMFLLTEMPPKPNHSASATDQCGNVDIPLTGTCSGKHYTQCCVPGNGNPCHGSDGKCYCDQSCHFFGDCCTDIEQYCPSGMFKQTRRGPHMMG